MITGLQSAKLDVAQHLRTARREMLEIQFSIVWPSGEKIDRYRFQTAPHSLEISAIVERIDALYTLLILNTPVESGTSAEAAGPIV